MGIDKMAMNKLQLHKGNVRLDTPDGKKQEAVHQFESYFVQMMVREMRKSVPKGIFDSPTMDMFVDLLDQSLAEQITESGGLGFADALQRSLGMRGMEDSDLLSGGSFSSQIERALGGQTSQFEPSSISNLAIDDLDMGALPLPNLPHSAIFQELSSSKSKTVFPLEGRISSRFGHRIDPIHGHDSHHKGLDIAAKEGTAIKAMRSGTVTFAGTRGGYGKLVVVDHGNGLESRYAHCSAVNVRVGQNVDAGAPIAAVGSTGRSTGPHLHLEVRKDGHAVDPMKYLKSK
jgi:murein DD-endopeptidase MepM/ murein hydrolase activator NlpD